MLSASLPQAWPGSRGSAAPRQGVGPACGSPGRVGRLTSSPCLKSSSPRASASPRPPAPPAAAEGPGQRLFLLPLAQLRGGPSLRAPRAAPAAPRGSLASLQLRGQAVPPPRTGAFSEGPPEGPLRPAQHLAPLPAASRLGWAGPRAFSLSRLSSLPLISTVPCLGPLLLGQPPSRRGLKVTHLQGLQKAQGLLPDVGQQTCRNHEKGRLSPRSASALGLQGNTLGRVPFLNLQGGWAGLQPAGEGDRGCCVAPPAQVGRGSPCLTLGHTPLGAGTPVCRHVTRAKNTGFAARQASAHHTSAG